MSILQLSASRRVMLALHVGLFTLSLMGPPQNAMALDSIIVQGQPHQQHQQQLSLPLTTLDNAPLDITANTSYTTTTTTASSSSSSSASPSRTRIAFGSCSSTDEEQPLWRHILAMNPAPAVWIWGGDNVYADANIHEGSLVSVAQVYQNQSSDVHERMYNEQLAHPGYAALTARTPIIGTWDDHDFGIDNGHRLFPHAAERQQLHLDFLGVPEDSPRRERNGVYASHLVEGPNNKTVKVLLLDVRTHRDPWPSQGGPAYPKGSMLGEEQWQWLETELRGSTADVHLIVSGIQVVNNAFPHALPRWTSENWLNFPGERRRLYELVLNSGARAPLFLSGDVHHAALAEEVCTNTRTGKSVSLLDLTSSGMSHSWAAPLDFAPLPDLKKMLMRIGFHLYQACDALFGGRGRTNFMFGGLNYGEVDIDWGSSSSSQEERQEELQEEMKGPTRKLTAAKAALEGNIRLRIYDSDGLDVLQDKTFDFSSLPGHGETIAYDASSSFSSTTLSSTSQSSSWTCQPAHGTMPAWRLWLFRLTLGFMSLVTLAIVLLAAPFYLLLRPTARLLLATIGSSSTRVSINYYTAATTESSLHYQPPKLRRRVSTRSLLLKKMD